MIRIDTLPAMQDGEAPRSPGRPKPVTILIIEDDAATRLALACMVAEERYQIFLASSAEDALERLPHVDPDVILCDFMLGGIDGRQLCVGLKRSVRWRYVPVIVITRLKGESLVADLLRNGADDVLIKPVQGEELRGRLAAALRTRRHYLQLQRGPRLERAGPALTYV